MNRRIRLSFFAFSLLILCGISAQSNGDGQSQLSIDDAKLLVVRKRVVKWAISNSSDLIREAHLLCTGSMNRRLSDTELFELAHKVVEFSELYSSLHFRIEDFDKIRSMQLYVVTQIRSRNLDSKSYEFDCVEWRLLASIPQSKVDIKHGMALLRSHPNDVYLLRNIAYLASGKREVDILDQSTKIVRKKLKTDPYNGFLHNLYAFCLMKTAEYPSYSLALADEASKEYGIAKNLYAGNPTEIRQNQWGIEMCQPLRSYILTHITQVGASPPKQQ